MIYQNGIKNDLIFLFKSIRENCKNISVLDVQDNFLSSIETTNELAGIIKDNFTLFSVKFQRNSLSPHLSNF
jgi:Ran GTPase-activating protein (RanGAP) involved in mRNA processing and transport